MLLNILNNPRGSVQVESQIFYNCAGMNRATLIAPKPRRLVSIATIFHSSQASVQAEEVLEEMWWVSPSGFSQPIASNPYVDVDGQVRKNLGSMVSISKKLSNSV